jgi:transcriptional regulator with XRE-family HTH domain
MTTPTISAAQLRAARTLLRVDQAVLAERSGVSVPTIKRMEAGDGPVRGTYENVAAVIHALESAGAEFTNGMQPGVRLRIVNARATQRNGNGEWGVLVKWSEGDPAEWTSINVARDAATEAETRGDARLAADLRNAAKDAERYASASRK